MQSALVRSVVRLEALGYVLIVIAGTLLHFAYDASGQRWWVGLFSAMNESVWEHLKLAFWPATLWALIQRGFMPDTTRNFWPAKALALLLMPAVIVGGFYGYTAILGQHMLALDILLFCIAVALGQLAAVAGQCATVDLSSMKTAAKLIIAIEAAAFMGLGFFPPELAIFTDPSAFPEHGVSGSR